LIEDDVDGGYWVRGVFATKELAESANQACGGGYDVTEWGVYFKLVLPGGWRLWRACGTVEDFWLINTSPYDTHLTVADYDSMRLFDLADADWTSGWAALRVWVKEKGRLDGWVVARNKDDGLNALNDLFKSDCIRDGGHIQQMESWIMFCKGPIASAKAQPAKGTNVRE
jgi:hypothetical protein